MRKILIPIDGSDHSLRAIDVVRKRHASGQQMEVHLLNVQLPVESGHARMFIGEQEIHDYHHEEGLAALRTAREMLDNAGIPHAFHILVGHLSDTIVRFAGEQGFDEIIMGTHGRSALTHLLLGSIASDVIRGTELPVTLVK